ncbi:MAG: C40 family peptidase [Alphaproteobacteria bacterium]|nr:C40 family peptidase [Alphaproteobacteria bacterium]
MDLHDPRLHAYRPDLADERLRGRIEARRFVAGEPWHVSTGVLSLRTGPSPDAHQGSELLFGENVRVFEVADGWAWLQNDADSYVGYADAACLAPGRVDPTHRVCALRTYLYPEPDLKSPVHGLLSMNAPVAVAAGDGPFRVLSDGAWVWAGHLAPDGEFETDHGAVALRFLGTPYLWGGRSSIGLDCSALVQMALARCGTGAPRDSDMQAESLGAPVPFDGNQTVLKRGDLVFWPGHVGIWLDAERFVHANATHMTTVAEPFAEAAGRIRAATGDEVTAVRRP